MRELCPRRKPSIARPPSLTLDHGHPEGALVPRDETLEVLEEEPRVVALRLQLADLLVLVQDLLARRVQLLRDRRELLKKRAERHTTA